MEKQMPTGGVKVFKGGVFQYPMILGYSWDFFWSTKVVTGEVQSDNDPRNGPWPIDPFGDSPD
jgi:hypothetical protein